MDRARRRRESPLRQRVEAGRSWRALRRRRVDTARRTSRRVAALVTALAVVGAVLTAGHVSQAVVNGGGNAALGTGQECEQDPTAQTDSGDLELHVEEDEDGSIHHHYRKKKPGKPPADPCEDGEGGSGGQDPGDGGPGDGDGGPGDGGPGDGDGDPGNGGGDEGDGLEIIGFGCDDSDLAPHDGFQEGPRCSDTPVGEIPAADQAPTLLITDAPTWVGVDEPFTMQVSTRNLVRDRFLPAAQGGYLRESARLTEDGLIRGHFHMACRILRENLAPDPEPVPAHFVAVEDSQGGAEPDIVTIEVPGLSEPGMYQCTAWAGDGSHRVPVAPRANQTPPVDSVRIAVS